MKVRVIISGRVQGVGYRAWTVAEARRMGLAGWVRNRRDGTVEAVFCGTAIATMIEDCKKGPMLARVDGIDSFAWNEEIPEGFEARETV